MATTASTMPSLSSCSRAFPSFSLRNGASLPLHIPKKKAQISCLGRYNSFSVLPIRNYDLGYGFFSVGTSHNGPVDPAKKVIDRGDLMAVKAAEVAAPTSEEASSQSKSSKKAKKITYARRILDIYQILQYPIITESAIKNVAEENALLFTVDVRADKKMIKDAVNSFFDVKVRKVNTSIRPDGTKKAFIMLSKEYNASDIAKRIGIFPK